MAMHPAENATARMNEDSMNEDRFPFLHLAIYFLYQSLVIRVCRTRNIS